MATKKYRCKVCGYIHEGNAAPEKCPVCQAPASEFELVKKKGVNTNSNFYIIMYSTVMVVIVATLLAVAALALKPMQDANILNEKKSAIMQSLGVPDGNYDEYVTAYAVNAEGERIEGIDGEQTLQMLFDLKGAVQNGTYPVFQSEDGRVVIPLSGQGLWDAIWGYVALDGDMNTVAGVVLDHKGETPGLGAEIATPKHQAKYVGKQIFEGGEFVSIRLRKGGATAGNMHEVDAITGGTKTSDGVTAMFESSLRPYLPFFEKQKADAEAAATEAEVMSNENNTQSNE